MSALCYSALVDGYISRSFGIEQAEQHLLNILKPQSNTISESYLPSIEGGCFIATSVSEYLQVQYPHPDTWVFDRRVVGNGSVIPQNLWIPHRPTAADKRRYVQDADLQLPISFSHTDGRLGLPLDDAVIGRVIPQNLWTPHTAADRRRYVQADLQLPIFFSHTDGRLGLPLDDAIIGRCDTLLNAQVPAPLGTQVTTHIRIGWRGYRMFKRQVQIRDESPEHNTVKLSKFAQHVGRSVDAFFKNREVDTENPDPRWLIGESGVQPNEVVIIGAIQVAHSGWMPILQLTRYIF